MRALVLILGALLAARAAAAPCGAESAPRTTALVELYTAQACAGCLPAGRWLSSLARAYPPQQVVALVLHVGYRDYLGTGPGARSPLQQRKLSPLQRMALVYTPQVLLQGREFRAWDSAPFGEALARIEGLSARAWIRLDIAALAPGALQVLAQAELLAPPAEDAALYLAAYARTPAHQHLVLEWQGPVGFGAGGRLAERRDLPLLPGAAPADSGVVAFVQDRRTAEVLQALLLSAC